VNKGFLSDDVNILHIPTLTHIFSGELYTMLIRTRKDFINNIDNISLRQISKHENGMTPIPIFTSIINKPPNKIWLDYMPHRIGCPEFGYFSTSNSKLEIYFLCSIWGSAFALSREFMPIYHQIFEHFPSLKKTEFAEDPVSGFAVEVESWKDSNDNFYISDGGHKCNIPLHSLWKRDLDVYIVFDASADLNTTHFGPFSFKFSLAETIFNNFFKGIELKEDFTDTYLKRFNELNIVFDNNILVISFNGKLVIHVPLLSNVSTIDLSYSQETYNGLKKKEIDNTNQTIHEIIKKEVTEFWKNRDKNFYCRYSFEGVKVFENTEITYHEE